MKKYYKVSFQYSESVYCSNIARAESVEDVEKHYSKYAWVSVNEADEWEVKAAERKGMPIVEVEHIEPAWEIEEPAETAETAEIIEAVREAVEASPARSAWAKGVKAYAAEIIDTIAEHIEYYGVLPSLRDLEKAALNGADNWSHYSWGGCSYCYDGDIARTLCTPSELKRTKGGCLRPNSSEEWLDVQARALFQAFHLVKECWEAVLVSREEVA